MISLEIIRPVDGTDLLRDFADRPFLNPGSLRLVAGRKQPRWLPSAPGCLYAGSGGELYASGPGEGQSPVRVGDLADLVFGRELLRRFAHTDHAGFIFATRRAKELAACLQDDTELDLPADKARRLIESGQRVYLSRNIVSYALVEAVRLVGRGNEGRKGEAGDGQWTMRGIFGDIS